MSDTVVAVVFGASLLLTLGVSAMRWDNHRAYRLLPLLWGALFGLAVAVRWDRNGLDMLASIAIGIGLGALFWFAIWVELRFSK